MTEASLRYVFWASYRLIRYQLAWFLLTGLMSFIFFLTPLMSALAIREIFDKLSGSANFDLSFGTLISLIALSYIIQLLTEVGFAVLARMFTLRNSILLRKNMIKGVFSQPGADALERTPSEAISRFRGDIESIVWFTLLIIDISAFGVFALFAFTLMFSINPRITVVIFLPFILVVIFINLARRKIVRYNDRSRKAAGRVTGAVGESFGAVQAIKVASAESDVLNHFRGLNIERRNAAIKDTALQASIRSVGRVIVTISTGVILLLAGKDMQNGTFTIGDFTLFVFLLNWVSDFINFLGEFMAWSRRNMVSYGRIISIMQGNSGQPPEEALLEPTPFYLKDPYPASYNLHRDTELSRMTVRNLSYTYRNSEQGIHDISFGIERGTLNVVVGEVGSGKTTLLRSVLGLLPASGEVEWNGQPVQPIEFMKPPRIAYTAQVPSLFSETITENILLGLPEDEKLEEVLKTAAIATEVAEFEGGLDTVVGPKGVRLSGGQKHRIATARMLIRDPELLVFDDLSSAVDVETERELWRNLFSSTGKTYLVTSHRKFVLQRADQIIVLDDGSVAATGRLDELLKSNDIMKEIWETIQSEGSE